MAPRPLDRELIKQFSPLSGLKPENQADLASKGQLQDLEAGRYANPSLRVAWHIARALNTTLADLLAIKSAARQSDRKRASKRR